MSPNLFLEFKFIPTPILKEHLADAVDSWTWDNDSEADKNYITRAECELEHRRENEVFVKFLDSPPLKQWYHLDSMREMEKEMAKVMMVDSSML